MEEKKKKTPIVTIIVIVIGFVLFMTGLILYFVSGDKYRASHGDVETIEENFDAREIQNLDFDLSVGKFTVKAGDNEKIKVLGKNVPKDGFELEASGDTFKIKAKEKEWYKNIYLPFGNVVEDTEFEILVPDKEYNKIKLDCGVGEIELAGLDTENFELDGGVGTIDIKDCNIGESNFDAGVGEIKFQGKLLGNTDIDMGVGAVTFDIDGYKGDYDIKADKSVKINSGKGGSENSRKYKISVDSGIGDIKLNFK